MLFVVFLLLVMVSTAAHDIPAFPWNNRPQLITFTFEGSLNTTESSIAVLSQSSNGRLACSRSVPATWFATDCTPGIQVLQSNRIEVAVVSADNPDDQSTLACLRSSTTINGVRVADKSNPSTFKYSLIESASDIWPFAEANMIRVPFVTSDPIAVMTALATSYDSVRAPIVISLSSLIQSIGHDATKILVQRIMSLDEVVAVSADQLASLAKALSPSEAESIVNLCRPSDQGITTTPVITTPVPTTAPVLITTTPVLPTKTPTPAVPVTQGGSTTNPSSAPVKTDPPTVRVTSQPSTSIPAVPITAAPLPGSTSTMTPTSASTTTPTSPSTTTPTSPSTKIPTSPSTTRPTSPSTTGPTSTSTTRPTSASTMRPTSASSPITNSTSSPITNATSSPIPNATSSPIPNTTTSPRGNSTSLPITNSTSAPTPNPSLTSSPGPIGNTSAPLTSDPTSKPVQFTTAPNLIGSVPSSNNGSTTDSSNDSSSNSSSSSSSKSQSTGYVPYVIGIGGGLCAMAVAIVYKVFKREDRFPPVITNGYVFENEDREIYDLEAYNSSVRVAPDSGEGTSSSYVHSDLESVSTMS